MPWITGQVRIGSEGETEPGWINTETGEQRSGSAPEFLGGGAPEGATDSNAHYLSIWNSLPGSDIERFRAMSAQGLGHSGVLQFLIDNNLATPEILNSGEVTALMQARASDAENRGNLFGGSLPIPAWAPLVAGVGAAAAAPWWATAAAGTTAGAAGGLTGDPGFTVDPNTGDTVFPTPTPTPLMPPAVPLPPGGAGTVPPPVGDPSTTPPWVTPPAVPVPTGGTGGTPIPVPTGGPGGIPNLVGDVIGGGLGLVGLERYIDLLRDESTQHRADRLPFLTQANSWLTNPNTYLEGPGRAAGDAVLRSLSVNGNPAGVPSSMALATEAGMSDWRNAVTGMANIGLSGADTRATLAERGGRATAQQYSDLGAGLSHYLPRIGQGMGVV